jgi:hypothetical protein
MFNPQLSELQFLLLVTALVAFIGGYWLHARLLPWLMHKYHARPRHFVSHPYRPKPAATTTNQSESPDRQP